MKVLFLTDNFPPEVNAPATRTFEHCREWVRLGADVTVITCAPNFPGGRVFDGYRNRLWQSEVIEGVRVIRVWSYVAANAGFLKRIVDFVSFAASAFVAGLFVEFDVVVATSPQFFTTFAGAGLSHARGKPWVFELRDLWPESIVATGSMKRGAVVDVLERIEVALYRDARMVVAVTDAFKADLVERGVPASKVEVVTNGVYAEEFRAEGAATGSPGSRAAGRDFVVGYVGTHGLAHGLEVVLDAAEALRGEPVRFELTGTGAKKQELLAEASRRGLTNVAFNEPVPRSELARVIARMDVALVPLKRARAFTTVIPSKIFEAAAAGRPILLGVEGQARSLLDQYGAGLAFEPESAAGLVDVIRTMRSDPAVYAECQAGCARMAADFDRGRLAHSMWALLERVGV